MRRAKMPSDSESDFDGNDDYDYSSSSESGTDDNESSHSDSTERALQLVSLERSNDLEDTLKLSLNNEVLDEVLSSCQENPICVIAITGHARCGKSFLLNYIKERLQAAELDEDEENWLPDKNGVSGFSWRHGYKPLTKGIWIWSRAFLVEGDGQKVAVLLIDTEGFNDESTTREEIFAILGLSILSSSITIMNLNSDIPDEVLDWLSAFTKYGNFCVKKDIEKPFQKLSFLVRDWTRLFEYPFGESSSEKIFKKMFAGRKDGSAFKKSWEEYTCCLLPNIGLKALQNSFQGNPSELNKEFLKRITTYITELTQGDNLSIKKILGNAVGAKELKQYLVAYVKLFNDKNSDLEAGIKPEIIWAVTADTTAKIKLDYGIEEYRKYYREMKERNFGTYLLDTFIDGMHVQAKDRAVKAFKKIKLPKDEEEQLLKKLEGLLESENLQLKKDNEGAKRSQIAENVGKACETLRSQLAALFPFTPEHGSSVPENMVFYDSSHMTQNLLQLSNRQKEIFLEEFTEEDEVGMRKLKDTIESILEPIVEEYTNKNKENRRRADQFAQQAVDDLKEEYLASMDALAKQLPNMDAQTLSVFHGKEKSSIQEKFKLLSFGTPSYQNKFYEELLELVEGEHENMAMNLGSTMSLALQTVTEEVEKYKISLKEKAEELEEEDEIRQFHDEATAVIIKKFHLKNPFPEGNTKRDVVFKKLETLLQNVFIQEIEEGVTRRRQIEEKIKKEAKASFSWYNNSIENLIGENEFLGADDFPQISKSIREDALANFVAAAQAILPDAKGTIDEEKAFLSEKLTASEGKWKEENEQKKQAATSQSETIFGTISNKYKMSMMEAVSRLKTIEELVVEHTRCKEELAEDFKKQCVSKNDTLRNAYIQKFFEVAEKEFDAVKDFFNKSLESENAGLMTALLTVKTEYMDNMKKEFDNKNGYFTNEDLNALHKQAKTVAFKKLVGGPPTSKEHKKELEKKLDETFILYKEKNDLVLTSFENSDPAIGIDLGTTYSCVGIYLNGKVKIVRNATSGLIVPSYVRIEENGTKIFGQPAKENAYNNPEATIYDAKRMIGRRFNEEELTEDMKFWPFTVVDDKGSPKVEVHGQRYFPEEISSFLLKHLKEEAEATLGIKVNKAVVTVPAYFTDGQRTATVNAGKLAGLEILGILNEPTAAALAYRLDYVYDEKTRNVLVFDLGGGTFDVAVLEMSKKSINVKSVTGDDHLGGEDFDRNMMAFCAEEFRKKTGIDLFKDKNSTVKTERDNARRRLRRLQAKCEEAKKALSTATSFNISLDAFFENTDLIVEVTRRQFEEINDKLFLKTIQTVDDALRSAKLVKKDIDDIVLVGGSTRIPKLQRMLKQHFEGKALGKQIDPDQAVAYGAAVQAAIMCSKPDAKLFDFDSVQEVTPMALGIEMANREFDVIIPKNTKIPITLQQEYETHRDNQASAWIRIFQGEKKIAADNKLLGEFTLEGIPPAKAGEERVQVTMHFDANGILNVKASCSNGAKEMTVNEENIGIMSKETVAKKLLEAKP